MEDCKVTKEIKLDKDKRDIFLEHDQKIVTLKMNVAGLSIQIHEMQKALEIQVEEIKKAANEYHKLIGVTAEELGLDMKQDWSFNTIELTYLCEEVKSIIKPEPELEVKA